MLGPVTVFHPTLRPHEMPDITTLSHRLKSSHLDKFYTEMEIVMMKLSQLDI